MDSVEGKVQLLICPFLQVMFTGPAVSLQASAHLRLVALHLTVRVHVLAKVCPIRCGGLYGLSRASKMLPSLPPGYGGTPSKCS